MDVNLVGFTSNDLQATEEVVKQKEAAYLKAVRDIQEGEDKIKYLEKMKYWSSLLDQ